MTNEITPMTPQEFADAKRRCRSGEEVLLISTGRRSRTTAGAVYRVNRQDSDGDLLFTDDEGVQDYVSSGRTVWFGLAAPEYKRAKEVRDELAELKTDKLIKRGREAQATLDAVKQLLAERTEGLI